MRRGKDNLYESMITLLSITFSVIIIILIYVLYNKIRYTINEYDEAKVLVKNIVSIYNKKIEQQNSHLNNSILSIEEIKTSIENSTIQNKYLHDSLNNIINKVTSTFMVNKTLASSIIDINKKINDVNKRIDELKTANEVLRNSFEFLKKENITKIKPGISLQPDLGSTFINLTHTEKQIIRILLSEGAKTSPMIMNTIGMTREHTSRLMKKLWQEGYIERDTNSMPFTYRPTKELENRINVQS